jgi:hypothetical protein
MQIEFRVLPETVDGDYICPVCGEPWDRAGVRDGLEGRKDGDMSREEALLFINGWGCPCCKNNIPRRLEMIDYCFELIKELENKLEIFELLGLFREEYENIRNSIKVLVQELDRIWEKLKEEEWRIRKS